MRNIATIILAMPAITALSACGAADNDPGPGGVSVGEARALDEAAEMVEAKRLPAQSENEENDAQSAADETAEQ